MDCVSRQLDFITATGNEDRRGVWRKAWRFIYMGRSPSWDFFLCYIPLIVKEALVKQLWSHRMIITYSLMLFCSCKQTVGLRMTIDAFSFVIHHCNDICELVKIIVLVVYLTFGFTANTFTYDLLVHTIHYKSLFKHSLACDVWASLWII